MNNQSKYIAPYHAVCITSNYEFVSSRKEMIPIIDRLELDIKVAINFANTKLPVKLVLLSECVIQGFPDELQDMDPLKYLENIAIHIDGPEIERFKTIAKENAIYLAAGFRTVKPEFPGRYFNEAILFNPKGEIELQHYKHSVLFPTEHSATPHDVLDQWIDLYGDNLDSFFPVADTEIGKIGLCLAMGGSYPEYIRGMAMNGTEVLCRMGTPHPFDGAFKIQNQAHALNNTLFVVGAEVSTGTVVPNSSPVGMANGNSHVVKYDGSIISESLGGQGDYFLAGEIDVESLREFRISSMVANWTKDLKTEIIRKIYEKQILPPNMYKDETPYNTKGYIKNVLKKQVELMIERGVYTPPSSSGWRDRIIGANLE
ncbi:hydrolase [Flammeovirga pectinis]|uniref:Hydrolase n=1 Tax=Flammeovirga pectinis TaxID=2494373 RepID=A0A3S9P718_9BACT|nr:nitrilase-related carbon-nitrogen hydrolase [Flammeovirga pectinis]AZQ63872.1 hydrolase [Flammeovirga pectinis]